jgi:peptidoglycan/xylan/chitin deacetylase (PgdA/CDA1 family)
MYHRVADEACDPWGLCVTPRHFDQQMDVLRESARIIPLRQLATSLVEGAIPSKVVAITFDDGYADNIHAAKPILERYDVPATFFLVSKHVGNQVEFWWDELDRLFLQPGYLPDSFKLDVNGSIIEAVLGEATNYSRESYNQNRNWRAWEDSPTARHSLYYALWKQMRPMANTDRQRILETLRCWAGADSQARTSHRALSHSELAALANDRLIEVGCHTMTHPQLSSLSPSMQSNEIYGCKEYLENIIGHPVKSFAYPYGGQEDYTSETVSLVRGMGFSSACSTLPGLVTKNSDPLQLPRMLVQNWSGEEFENTLSEWFGEPKHRPERPK